MQGRVLRYDIHTRKLETLVNIDNPEGILVMSDGSLLLTEDLRDGRLLRLSISGQLATIVHNLSRPEGIRLGTDGTVYIAETGSGRVLAYHHKEISIIAEDLDEPDQLAIDRNGALWIAEDANPGRILRLRKAGNAETMISGLASPQGMVFDRNGGLYVAEQGKNRVLLFSSECFN